MKLPILPKTRKLLITMLVIASVIVASGYFYYQRINRFEDPRLISARKNFARYDRLMRENQFTRALALLDDIEAAYRNTPGYADSYEMGVIANNRASVYLVKAETERLSQEQPEDTLVAGYLEAARRHTETAIRIYNNWLAIHAPLGHHQVTQRIAPHFSIEDPAFAGLNVEKIVARRVEDIMMAVQETRRRLSVTHTNMGVIARYQGRLEAAQNHYEHAISLWDRNHVARNNLNVLQGRPLEKPSLIETLFPPDRRAM